MIQVTFLGTGDAYATRQRTNTSLLVRGEGVTFLIECGPSVLNQLAQSGSAPDEVTHLFVSHRHGDHFLGLPMFLLLRSMGGAASTLMFLGNSDVIQTGQKLIELVYAELRERLTNVTWRELPSDKHTATALTPQLKISTMPMHHSQPSPTLGLRMDFVDSGRSLVYTGDTTFIEETAAFAQGCDLLVHEANFSETLHPGVNAASYGHSTARQAGRTAARAGCRILALVHMSGDYTGRENQVRAEAAEEFDGQIIIPNDGVTLLI